MNGFWKDVRYAFRSMRKSPGFTAAAMVSLALGIGANTAIFTLINAVFLQPLPVKDAASLITMYTSDPRNPGFLPISYPNYQDYRDNNEAFSAMLASSGFGAAFAMGGEPRQIFGEIVSGNYFELLGVKPALGRMFSPEEDGAPGAHPVLVLSNAFWMKEFGGSADALGRSVNLNGHPFTVIGVAPPNFKGTNALNGPALWAPLAMHAQLVPFESLFNSRRFLWMTVVGRLKPGVSVEQALASLQALAAHLQREYPKDNEGRNVKLLSLAQSVINPNGRAGVVGAGGLLMSVVVVILLIACANIANLLLARASSRRKEIAVRLSMGASRGRVIRQLLTESMLLSLAGGALGLLAAAWSRTLLWSLRPPFLKTSDLNLTLDWRVLLFTLALAVLTGFLFGLAPALQAARPDLVTELKERTSQAARAGRFNIRNALVVSQVALSLVALIGAGLFLRSMRAAQQTDPGFAADKIGSLAVNPGVQGYSPARAQEFYRQALERIAAIPGVASVTMARFIPMGPGGFSRSVFLEGQDPTPGNRGLLVNVNSIGPRYFETMGIRVLRGRMFADSDREGSRPVAIVNETMAQKFWPSQDAIGKRFRFFGDTFSTEVVGIAHDSKYFAVSEDPTASVYSPALQVYSPGMELIYRSVGDPAGSLGAVRQQVQAFDKNLLITNISTMRDLINQSLWAPRMGAALLAVFGFLALGLSALGIYGVMAYSVAQRTSELGIRLALGARPATVFRLILRQGMGLVLAGIALGGFGSLWLARLISNLLFGVPAHDPGTFLATAAILAGVAALASFMPARRATRIDPIAALRAE
jgi:predicted permease